VTIEAVLAGRFPAALPVATWRHHPLHDQNAARLVEATLADQALFGCDLVKLTPASTWQLVDHGLADAWQGDPIGRRRILRPVIQQPDDWDRLRPCPAGAGFRAEILAAAAALRRRLPAAIPVVATVFNPLFVAIGLAGLERFQAHRREAPERVAVGLRALQDDGLQLLEALADTGVDGIFLAVQHANAALGPAELYAGLALEADRALLAAMQRCFRLSLLHLHGAGVHVGLFQPLPFSFLHYDMAEPGNPAPEVIERPPGCGVATGPPPALFAAGDPAALTRWVRDLARRMADRPFLLAPGCAVPLAAPESMHLALVAAARAQAEECGSPVPVALPLDHGGPVDVPFKPFPAPETLLSVVDRFRWVVDRHGERPALIDGLRRWTYAALQERVEALAEALLCRLGHGEEPVAVLLPQDARAPLALLAVLAAGRTPVPLDPAFPLERNRRILERAGAALVVVAAGAREGLEPLLPLATVWLALNDEGWPVQEVTGVDATGLAAPARRPLRGSDPAWLLFTSGSTGAPKGVLQNQRGLLHDVMQYTNAIHLGPEDRLTQLYSASVSGALRDIYGALLNGACLYPLSLAELGVAGVLAVIRRERLTVLHAIPGIFRLLIESLAPAESLPDVRLLYLAGDRVDRADVEAHRAHFLPHCWLYLGIGSTENATLYAHHFLGHHTPLAEGSVPVGRELPDRALRVLGDDDAPVPVGAIGEIECTSRYLAQGYWRDPETTAQRFLPVPGDASIRRFRSGDLARLGADGLLTFVGRRDNQIKIAGRRVETGEVEGELQTLPGVERALVMALPDQGGAIGLVAWLQGGGTAGSPRPGIAELQAFLQQPLPQGLVPSRFVWLEAWPLTANGKIDRRALRAQLATPPANRPAGAGPQTPLHHHLQAIWAEVLGHSAFGIHDSFFLVGGHSLAAVRVLSRVEQRFGSQLTLSAFLAHPTITALEACLLARGALAATAPAPLASAMQAAEPDAGLETYPASFSQARLWFLHQLEPGITSYHIPALWRLRGDLDRRALEQALTDLIRRHTPLRTSFSLAEGELLQRIHPAAPLSLACEALRAGEADAEIRTWIAQEVARPFDLAAGSLLRARLLALGPRHHLLLLTVHHLAHDGWSGVVFCRDLVALYNARRTGRPPQLRPLPLKYHDFSIWQRQRLQGPYLQRLREYWGRQLEGLEPLSLPADRPRPLGQAWRAALLRFRLDAAPVAALERLCAPSGASLQVGLLALVGLLLHRSTGQETLAVATPVLGRAHPDLEDLVGCFVNTIPIVLRFGAPGSFRELVARAAATALAAFDQQELPFEAMVELHARQRDLSRTPLVQVLLQLKALEIPSLGGLDGLKTESLDPGLPAGKVDLEFFFRQSAAGDLVGELTYNADLFNADRIERMVAQLQTLLVSQQQDPDLPCLRLNLLPERERALIETWQEGPRFQRPMLGVAGLVAAQAERRPEAIALCLGDRFLSYRDLNGRAMRLARQLLARGVAPEGIVAVCLERSFALVEALLAIVKARAAYLPLDPLWPAERIRSLGRAARPQLVITTAALAPLFADQGSWQVLCVAEDGPPGLPMPPSTVVNSVAPSPDRQLVYLNFTSGSTGEPKAVLVEEAGILRLFDPANPYRFTEEDRVLQLAPTSFDLATLEIWGALLHGGCLVLAPPGPPDLAVLAELLQRQRITKLWLTAGLFHSMVAAFPEAVAAVPTVLAGGDVLEPTAVRRLLARMPAGHRLINGYGPTEATTFTTCHALEGGEEQEGSRALPIGRPIAGTTVRVLDAAGQLCPIGIPGELHIGGVGLARGYLNQPELTASCFIPDPYAGSAGELLYRSGDLASWNADGTLAFHGRLDHQVKWNGVRIDPAEIEAQLQAHPAVEQAVVMLRRDDPAHPRLVAYWLASPAGEESSSETGLRAFLAERLPEPILPTVYVRLRSLPLTGSGKIDRQALPAPMFLADADDGIAPSTEVEARLHRLWSSVLGHSCYGVGENFFQVGGHSLAAAQLAAAIAAEFARPMAVADIFRFPTIAAQARGQAESQALVSLQPQGERAPLFAVHGWGGSIAPFIGLSRALRPHRPLFGLQARGSAAEQAHGASVRAIAAAYSNEILRQRPVGPIHLIGYSAGGWYAHAVAEALLERGAWLGLFAVLDTHPTARIHRRQALLFYGRVLAQQHLRQPRHSARALRDLLRHLSGVDVALARWPQPLPAALKKVTGRREEFFCDLLMDTYRPARLPVHVDVFATPQGAGRLQSLWRSYATAGVTVHPLFTDHFDFVDARHADELALVLEQALQRVEAAADRRD
jgi:amino acid adenylation domain-containing protein